MLRGRTQCISNISSGGKWYEVMYLDRDFEGVIINISIYEELLEVVK